MPGDIIECWCDREVGSIAFLHNDRFLGNAFIDEELKTGNLYFAISFFWDDSSVEIITPSQFDLQAGIM